MNRAAIHQVVTDWHPPAGVAGPDPMDFDLQPPG
jgi:hypothetical protein